MLHGTFKAAQDSIDEKQNEKNDKIGTGPCIFHGMFLSILFFYSVSLFRFVSVVS